MAYVFQRTDIVFPVVRNGLFRKSEKPVPRCRSAFFAVRKSCYGAAEQAFLRDATEHAASPFHFFGIVKDIFPVYHILFMKLFLSKYFTVGNVFLFIPRHARDMTHT